MKWSKLNPNQFYFHIGYSWQDRQYLVTICPKEYFDTNGYCYDNHLSIDVLLPDYMIEIMESTFETLKSPEETKSDLIKLGFLESISFSKFCQEHDPYC